MFYHITIHLQGPICLCEKQDLGWANYIAEDKRIGLCIYCKQCQVKTFIPPDKFVARFNLDVGYRGGIKEDTPEEILEKDDNIGNKIIGPIKDNEFTEDDKVFLKVFHISPYPPIPDS